MTRVHLRLNNEEKVPYIVKGESYTYERERTIPISIPEEVTEAYLENSSGKAIALIRINEIEQKFIDGTNVQITTIQSKVIEVYHNGY